MKTAKERIDALEAELQQLKKELETPTFEVGKWYNSDGDSLLFITEFNANGEKTFKGYGFHFSKWSFEQWWNYDNFLTPATDKEVEAALIKEAKKRGFKDGVKIKPVSGDINILFDNKFEYLKKWHEYKNALFIDNYLVFSNGKWAEIIKDEPIKVGGYEVKKNADYYEIGCREIPKCDIKDLSIFMSSQRFTKVSFDGVETDLETINKILDL